MKLVWMIVVHCCIGFFVHNFIEYNVEHQLEIADLLIASKNSYRHLRDQLDIESIIYKPKMDKSNRPMTLKGCKNTII